MNLLILKSIYILRMKLINKIKNYINRRVLRTPGVEFFIENKDLNLRKNISIFG